MLLPHGYDGNGPEHSSCRTERYLLLCDQDDTFPADGQAWHQTIEDVNMKVAHPSTAANYFHLLRLQMRMPFRKPLVVVAPKKLLRFQGATSSIADFNEGTTFKPIIEDQNPKAVAANQVRKVILCSGQVYFELEKERTAREANDVVIVRVESLCPWPFEDIAATFK